MSSPPPPPSPLASPEPWDLVATSYADEIVPQFERYAAEALRLAELPHGATIVDVACGPGTLALLASPHAARVAALDFAPEMVARLRARASAAGVHNVEPEVGDGQALPYRDAEFDAGFSMFGLMFFPDRDRGLRELHRVVRPGGRVVVSSWLPLDQVPTMRLLFAAIGDALPHLPFGKGVAPLGDEDTIRTELAAAGFTHVEPHRVTFATEHPSTAHAWASFERTMAPLVLLQHRLGADAWRPLSERILARLITDLGADAQSVSMPAWLTVASR